MTRLAFLGRTLGYGIGTAIGAHLWGHEAGRELVLHSTFGALFFGFVSALVFGVRP